jgi:signal transduction histidine kinase/ligand-binding sensor domain-containing protein
MSLTTTAQSPKRTARRFSLHLSMQRKTLLFLAWLFACVDLAAQQYPFVNYTPKNGLVNSRVRKMYQDSKGRMYFLTWGGLSVYDGARFRNYTTQNGLAHDMVNDVLEVGNDSILVATNTNKLNVLVNGVATLFKTSDGFSPTISQFLKSKDGQVYVTADEGLFVINKNGFEKLSFPMKGGPVIQPFLGTIIEMGDLLVLATNDLRRAIGLYLYDKKNRKLLDALPEEAVYWMAKDNKNRVWLSLHNNISMLDSLSLVQGRLKLVPTPAPYRAALPSSPGVFVFNEYAAWIIRNGNSVLRLNNDGSTLNISLPGDQGNHPHVDNIFIDKENILWISNEGAGVFKLVNTSLQLQENSDIGSNAQRITYVSYRPDTTWYVLNNKRVVRKTINGTQEFDVVCPGDFVALDQLGNILLAYDVRTLYTGTVPSASDKKIVLRTAGVLHDSDGYRGLTVKDATGNLIIAERFWVSVLRNNKPIFRHPVSVSDLVESLKLDKQGRLWLTTRFHGIFVFALQPDRPSEYLKVIHHFENELKDISPRCMTFDKNENIWIGTRHHGLLSFMLKDGQLKRTGHYQTRQGLTDNFVTTLACDSFNNILAGMQTGLDRLVPVNDKEYRIENITKSNGVFGYVSFSWVDRRNQAYALINNGPLLQIAPLQAIKKNYEPSLFIEELKINGLPVRHHAGGLELPYTQRNLSFNVAAPAFVDEQQVQYSYLLEGSGDNQWSEATTNASINFLNLPPGNYRLNVKAFFPSTTYASRTLSYSFVIIPPWWQTAWFRIIAAVVLLGITILIIRYYYKRKLERQKTMAERQQAVEKERTRIATDMHDDLGAGLSRIKFLSETIGIKKQQQQPIEEDINKIREYSHDMIDKMGEIVWALNKENDSLSDLLSYTRAYAVDYLSQNGIKCLVEAPEQFPSIYVSGEFRRNIYLTVKEALHNIVKHAQADHVVIRLEAESHLGISIRDDGAGFNEQYKRPFSNGLNNMRKRMDTLNGRLEIRHQQGTTIILSVPLP